MKNSKAPRRLTSLSHSHLHKESPKKNGATQSNQNSSSSSNLNANPKDQICDICAQNVPGTEREKIFALGNCDHHVCYVCSARLIVVCKQSECPICRKKLDNVVFSSDRNRPYAKYNLRDFLFDEKYKIYFETKAIREAFEKLLRYQCLVCFEEKSTLVPATAASSERLLKDDQQKSGSTNDSNKDKQPRIHRRDSLAQKNESDRDTPSPHSDNAKSARERASTSTEVMEEDSQGLLKSSDIKCSVFKDVFGLRNHLNYMHKLKLCDLCLTHNKLFPFEYSYYNPVALKKHMKEGEPNTSHRGHPNCPLCRQIFFNNDELIQHMSREHYHCHLCGRSPRYANMLIYFLDYEDLRQHFKIKHFLCERGNCKYEQFTSAFDTKIDYQLHVVQVHGNPSTNLSRGEARQQRTIQLESAPHRARDSSPSRAMNQGRQPNSAIVSTGPMATANSARNPRPESMQTEIVQQRMPSRAEFPALGHNASNPVRQTVAPVPATYVNQYPSLAPTSSGGMALSSSFTQRSAAGPSSMRDSFVRSIGGGMRNPEEFGAMDFPPLPEQPKGKKAKKKNVTSCANGRGDNSVMTLDQLISSSLTISSDAARTGSSRRNGSKMGAVKSQRSAKSRPLKIQLS